MQQGGGGGQKDGGTTRTVVLAFKRIVAPVRGWLKVVCLEREKLYIAELLSFLNFSVESLIFNPSKYYLVALTKMY